MKCKIPEISWHNRDPVLSVDIQPRINGNNNYYRLASGGSDAHVLIWYMKLTSGDHSDIELDLVADLTRHQRAINVVKWSPSGELLASGDDESVVFIWKQKSDSEPLNILDPTNEQDKEIWITLKVLRGHMEDIYDLCWAPNSQYLVSGSVDNSAMIWDVQKGKSMAILNDHKGFVQGVAWDPKNQYIATLSTDRYLRIFDIQSKKVLHRINKGLLPVPEDSNLYGKRVRLFHDDTLQTFFRRLNFTPDGKLLLTPAGVADYDGCTRPLNTTYVFSRYGFRQPAIVLPCPDQYTVAVKCCPLLFNLRPFNAEKNPPVVSLPYRMIFAVATKSSVYFYDTQQKQPFALISNIHYTRLTDITWSSDGRVVVVSSTDGFCSLITFEHNELGEEYKNSEAVLEAALAQITKKTKKQKDGEISKSRKSSTDDSTATKETATIQQETQLEKVMEEESFENKEEKSIDANKATEHNKETIPILIKNNTENKDNKKASPIAINLKPSSTEESINNVNPTKGYQETISVVGEKNPKPNFAENNYSKTDIIKEFSMKSDVNQTKSEPKATPIAIKRKPGPVTMNENKLGIKEDVKTKQTAITMIDNKIDENESQPKEQFEEKTSPKVNVIIPSKVLAAEIFIDKEILSSDEKFESPEKKSRPATPIMVRRHPRTPSSGSQAVTNPQTISSMANVLKGQLNQSPISSLSRHKTVTPIAVRRAPRTIIDTPLIVNTTSLVEEAMDAWPVSKEPNTETTSESSEKSLKEAGITPLPISDTVCERTEDIRLVFEETNEEASIKETLSKPLDIEKKETNNINNTPNQRTPSEKTPRRVALKTISTPKSKKKLLD